MPTPWPSGADLFGAIDAPDGFLYREDLFSPAEEQRIARELAALPFQPFAFHGHLGNRRIVSFGYRYDYAARTLRTSGAMPDFLEPLRAAASRVSAVPAARLAQALVTEYAPGAGIGWHRDKPMFETVVALSFLAPCALRLRRRRADGWARKSVPIAPRSAYVLQGPAREAWEHSILPMDRLRYSVTFRALRPGYDAPR